MTSTTRTRLHDIQTILEFVRRSISPPIHTDAQTRLYFCQAIAQGKSSSQIAQDYLQSLVATSVLTLSRRPPYTTDADRG